MAKSGDFALYERHARLPTADEDPLSELENAAPLELDTVPVVGSKRSAEEVEHDRSDR